MNARRRISTLGDVLRRSEDWVQIDPSESYKEVTVRLWGKGVVLRRIAAGSEISGVRRIRARSGQFILSRIDARNGAFGLIPDALDGAVLSNDFPVFDVDHSQMLPQYLSWLSKTRGFVDQCRAVSEGTTNRVRLKEDRFLAIQVVYPPLSEQRRVVAAIEQVASRSHEAIRLRRLAAAELKTMWNSLLGSSFRAEESERWSSKESAVTALESQAEAWKGTELARYNNAHPAKPSFYPDGPHKLPRGWVWTDLGSVLTHLVDCVNDTPDFVDEPTGFLGLKSSNIRPYGLELHQRWYVTEEDFGLWNRREQPQPGDLILTREAPMGNICILPDEITACLTQRLMLLRCDSRFVSNRYLLHYLSSPQFNDQIDEKCRGMTVPHIRVKDTPAFRVPLPPQQLQARVVRYLDGLREKVVAVRDLQAATDPEIAALLPSFLDLVFKGED